MLRIHSSGTENDLDPHFLVYLQNSFGPHTDQLMAPQVSYFGATNFLLR